MPAVLVLRILHRSAQKRKLGCEVILSHFLIGVFVVPAVVRDSPDSHHAARPVGAVLTVNKNGFLIAFALFRFFHTL